jgi:hypothetical protein
MPEETYVGFIVVLSSREGAVRSAIESAIGILEALAVASDFAGKRSAGGQTEKRSGARGHAQAGSFASAHYVNPL